MNHCLFSSRVPQVDTAHSKNSLMANMSFRKVGTGRFL